MSASIDCIAFHARLTPHRLAARDLVAQCQWSYAEFDRLIGQLAAALAARGVILGERVAVLARNSPWQVALHFACTRVGAIYVPLNGNLCDAEIAVLLTRIRPRLLLGEGHACTESFAGFVAAAQAFSPLVCAPIDPDRISLLVYTSGTCGRSKGVMLTEANLQQSACNFAMSLRVCADSSFLCEMPMFHVLGLVMSVRPALMFGGSIQVSDEFLPERTLAWLTETTQGISHYIAAPDRVQAIRAQPHFDPKGMHHLTALITSGAPFSPDAMAAWLDDGVAMVTGFVLSEAGTVFGMSLDPNIMRTKLGSAGIAAPGIQMRVVDQQGHDCSPGQLGELWLRGSCLCPGYWQDLDETARVISPEGWLRTGDVVRCDEDGFFWIIDRVKDRYWVGGKVIYPTDIEQIMHQCPDVAECAVVAVPERPLGEVGYLAIVPKQSDFDQQKVWALLRAQLLPEQLPKHIRLLRALPRTAIGHVHKAKLRHILFHNEQVTTLEN